MTKPREYDNLRILDFREGFWPPEILCSRIHVRARKATVVSMDDLSLSEVRRLVAAANAVRRQRDATGSEHVSWLYPGVAEKVSKIADESHRNDLTAAAGILAGLRFDNCLIRRIFRGEIMIQSVIYREILKEGEQIGEKHGRLAVIQKLLTQRFGVNPAETQAQLSALSTPELDELNVAFLGFNSMDDFVRWPEKNRQ
jgi:hypothetical protein